MGFFTKKPRVSLTEFCRDLYDRGILCVHPEVAALRFPQAFTETIKRSVCEVDATFAPVNSETLTAEVTLIRFEVFGLAWLHQCGADRAVEQSDFTRLYLAERGRADIWESMQPYNRAAARSSTVRNDPKTLMGRANITFVNSLRAEHADLWFKSGLDLLAIGRVVNRLCTEVPWKDGDTARLLMLTLLERLDCELNGEAQWRLAAVITGLYDGARGSLKAVKVVG